MTTKHTPGPWTVGDSLMVYDDNAQEVAMPYGESLEANARLIAAAPDLLAALEYVVNFAEAVAPSAIARTEMLTTARAAIAKAKGGA